MTRLAQPDPIVPLINLVQKYLPAVDWDRLVIVLPEFLQYFARVGGMRPCRGENLAHICVSTLEPEIVGLVRGAEDTDWSPELCRGH